MTKAALFIVFLFSSFTIFARERVYSEKTFYGWAIFMVIAIIIIAIKNATKNK